MGSAVDVLPGDSRVAQRVVKCASNVTHLFEGPATARTIREQDEVAVAYRIYPEGATGERDMAECRRRHSSPA
jgi:hypothetical protein